jgi:hypothetical protein
MILATVTDSPSDTLNLSNAKFMVRCAVWQTKKQEVEIHGIPASGSLSTFGKCQPSSSVLAPNPSGKGGRCCDLDLDRVESVSVIPEGLLLLTVNATPGASPSPFLCAREVFPSNKRSVRVRRKSIALRTPERLYMNMTIKVAAEGIWRAPLPKPVIQRTTLRGRTITEYTSG